MTDLGGPETERAAGVPYARRLVRQLVAFVVLFGLIDTGIRWYARTHFITSRKVTTAVAAGDGCLAFSGGSDMQSALQLPTLEQSLGPGGPCVADLALGGTSPDVRFMAFREYLAAPRRPSALVIGFKGHDVIDERDYAPGHYVGNDAAGYVWGSLADFSTYYPTLSFSALDNAFRFLLFQLTALGANRQTLWVRVDLLEQKLGLKPKLVTNELGNVQAFLEIEAEMRAAALANHEQRDPATYHLAVWHARLVEAARSAGVTRISFVQLPSSSAFERALFPDASRRRAFDDFMTRTADKYGGKFVDLTHEPWVEDSLLVDGLHYSPRGAALISEAIGRALAPSR